MVDLGQQPRAVVCITTWCGLFSALGCRALAEAAAEVALHCGHCHGAASV